MSLLVLDGIESIREALDRVQNDQEEVDLDEIMVTGRDMADGECFALLQQLLSECSSSHPVGLDLWEDEDSGNLYQFSDIASLLNQINSNQLYFLKLDQMKLTGNILPLTTALLRHQQLETFRLQWVFHEASRDIDLSLLASCLLSLPNLKNIVWHVKDSVGGFIFNDSNVLAITSLVAQKIGLKEIILTFDSPFLTELDWQGPFRGLQNISSLTKVTIFTGSRIQLSAQNYRDIARMIEHNPSIEELSVSINDSSRPFFGALHNNSSLKVLNIMGDPLSQEHVALAGQMLRHNSSIEKFVFYPSDNVSIRPVAEALGTSNNTLKELRFWSKLSDDDGEHLGQMLRNNDSIEELQLRSCSLPIIDALEANRNLKAMRTCVPLSCKQAAALVSILENQNFTLEIFDIRVTDEFRPKIDFNLRLNRVFLRKWLLSSDENATSEEWVEVIISAKSTTDVVFYYLCNNPSLVANANLNCPALM
jgi:hypothetical protein